ncbi:MAG TPA: ATP-binding cassette domain-containing protein [Gemmatimonadaceae bacterium]|nr:ATP-binding cassette domain-containing protein [Gemmatimonadaceae bacterium]
MSATLIVDCVAKSYDGKPALEGASLRAVPGELRALVGAKGSGKSTLLKIAAGVVMPDTGSVYFTGQTYKNMLPGHIADLGLFYIPDENLLSNAWSVGAQLEMIRDRFDGRQSEAALELVGLADFRDSMPSRLTADQRRRAELAAAIVRRPRCVLVDEPYRGIEASDARTLTRLFRELAASGVAVVVSGSEVPELLAAADRVTWCRGGKTQEMGPPRSAARSPEFRNECLGPHYEPQEMTAGSNC